KKRIESSVPTLPYDQGDRGNCPRLNWLSPPQARSHLSRKIAQEAMMYIDDTSAAAGSPPGGGGATRPRLTSSEWVLLLLLAAVQFTQIIDFVIVMPLGPVFEKALELTTRQFGWIVSSYGFAACLSGLLAARFMERFDRKTAMLFLYAGFTIGTISCAI